MRFDLLLVLEMGVFYTLSCFVIDSGIQHMCLLVIKKDKEIFLEQDKLIQ